jgi:tetratricopeptide (TPR) repeat protein
MAGDPRAALAELDALELGEDTHPDVLGALAHARAEAWLQLDRPEQAHEAWMSATRAADAAGDDAAFVRTASILAFLDVAELDRLDAAEVWLDRARSRARNVELTHGERFTLELRGAVVTRYRGEARAAADALEHLLESEGRHANPDQRGTLHHNLGELLHELGKRPRAAEHLRLAIDLRTEALGSDHRHVGQSRFMLSRVLIDEGELELAEQELELAAEIFADVEGGAPERVMAEESRAILSAMRGDLAKANDQMVAVIALARETLGPDDRRHATLWVNHGRMLMMQGRLDEAAGEVQRGLDHEARVAGEAHHGLADGLGLLAEIELGRGRPREGQRLADRAAALASSAGARLDLRLAALMCRAHAECDAKEARAEANALLDAADEGVDTEARRAALGGWDAAVAAYPGCATP